VLRQKVSVGTFNISNVLHLFLRFHSQEDRTPNESTTSLVHITDAASSCQRKSASELQLSPNGSDPEPNGETRPASMGGTGKLADQCGDLIRSRVQREMAGVQNVDLSFRNIAMIRLRLRRIE
jgi:hypothetical protein